MSDDGYIERQKKRINDKVSLFDRVRVSFTPGDTSNKERELESIASRNEADERRKAELEAVRRKRMNASE